MYPRMHSRIALAPLAAVACGLATLAGPAAGSPGPVGAAHDRSDQQTRPCFIEPPRWNEALDGPLPRCALHGTDLPLPGNAWTRPGLDSLP